MENTMERNEILETLLRNRGYSEIEIDHIIYHKEQSIKDPLLLPNAYEAAVLLKKYCDKDSEIHIFADYDVDGLTSGIIIHNILETYSKGYVSLTFPTRQEGYGMNMDWCKKIVANSNIFEHEVLVVTVDNGIACMEQIDYLQKNGIEVLVLDHHEAKETVPDCLIVDPHGAIKTEEYYHLAGCGVTFKVCQILAALYGNYDMEEYTQYVALGTLADVMELTEENIALIQYGIDIMNQKNECRCNIGLYWLLDYCGLTGCVTPKDLQFDIIPKLNACGRLETIDVAYSLLDAKTKGDVNEAINHIANIDETRKDLTKSAQKLIEQQFAAGGYAMDIPFIMVLPQEYSGMCGAIASKAIEATGCPASFIFTQTTPITFTGSGRSGHNQIDLQDVLNHELDDNNIMFFGGHKMAAGLTLMVDQYDTFSSSVSDYICNIYEHILLDPSEDKDEKQKYDIEIDFMDIDKDLYNKYSHIPFRESPIFKVNGVICTEAKASKNNDKNIEYHFVKNNNLKKIWVWGQPKKNIVRKTVTLYGNIEKDFRNKTQYTMRIENIEQE